MTRSGLGAVRAVADAMDWLLIPENYYSGRMFRIGCYPSGVPGVERLLSALPSSMRDRVELVDISDSCGDGIRGLQIGMVIVDDIEVTG